MYSSIIMWITLFKNQDINQVKIKNVLISENGKKQLPDQKLQARLAIRPLKYLENLFLLFFLKLRFA